MYRETGSCAPTDDAQSPPEQWHADFWDEVDAKGFSWGYSGSFLFAGKEVNAQSGELPDLTQQPNALRGRPAKRQAGPLAADDYAEGNIGHKKNWH